MVPAILSLNSHLVYGHVGAQATILPLQMRGYEVWHVPSVLYSNHPGHGGFRGNIVAGNAVTAILDGLTERNLLSSLVALHSGFIGRPAHARAFAHFMDSYFSDMAGMSRLRPLYCCDPVLGDNGRLYIPEDVASAIRDILLPRADILVPNRFELAWLSGRAVTDLDSARVAGNELLRRLRHTADSAPLIVCTSALDTDETLGILILAPSAAHLVSVPKLSHAPNGTGDLFAALLLGGLLQGSIPALAVQQAAWAVYRVIAGSGAGAKDPALVANIDFLKSSCSTDQIAAIGITCINLDNPGS